MASGLQSKLALAATTYTTIASTPASGYAQILTISLLNRGGGVGTFPVRLAVVNNGSVTPSAGDFIEYDTHVNGGGGVLERTGIVLNNGQTLVAYAPNANFTSVTYGIEDTAVVATGIISKLDLSAATYTSITSGPGTGRIQTVSVNFCNRNSSPVTINLVMSATPTSPANSDFLEYGITVPANGVLERTGIVLNNSIGLGAYASTTGVSVVSWCVDSSVA